MLYSKITEKTPVLKGWSSDRKYKVIIDGLPCLLRVSATDRHDRVLRQFRQAQTVAALGLPMCRPLEFGTCPEGVYVIQNWIEGRDAEVALPEMTETEQYAYGLDAGKILQKIHTIPAPADISDWEERFNRKIDRKIAMYESCPQKYARDEEMLRYLKKNRHLLRNRPQCYQHGDYHLGNMMIDEAGILTIIDFDRDDYGDPWEEFNRIVWCAQEAPAFARGMVDGYFNGCVPMAFWELLILYICSNTLSSLPWAIPFGESEIQVMRRQQADILNWYDNLQNVIPSWYRTH